MMIDIHTHILPGMDDGARTVEESMAMLRLELEHGVSGICLTPHFYPRTDTLEQFLARRAEAWELLSGSLDDDLRCRIRLGAEVHYDPQILNMDIRKLTLGDSDYLLLEMPYQYYPAYAEQVVIRLLDMGLTPVLAHVERFDYFRKEPALLKRLIDLGALAQVGADALFDRTDRGFARACLAGDMAQFVASDAHNMTTRKPDLDTTRRLPEDVQESLGFFARTLWENEVPPMIRSSIPKKKLFGGY